MIGSTRAFVTPTPAHHVPILVPIILILIIPVLQFSNQIPVRSPLIIRITNDSLNHTRHA